MPTRLSVALLALAVCSACGATGPASLAFVEISPQQPRIGDVVTIRFIALDSRGVPLAGQAVDFKLQSEKAGVTLAPLTAPTNKGSGIVETQLVATARVNSVIVVATAGDKSVLSPPITFAGSVPNGREFTFQCGEIAGDASGGRHAIGAYDQTRHLIAGVKINCIAHVADRNADGVPNALVSFEVEAGAIGPSQTSLTNVVGNASTLYKTSYPLPADVKPDRFTWAPIAGPCTGNDGSSCPSDGSSQSACCHTGAYLAPLWMHPFEWVANPIQYPRPHATASPLEPSRLDPIRRDGAGGRINNNPRDGLVTMIAVTSGEEGFTDANNNGTWDPGEDFDDLTEPFVDSNDNGTRDFDEKFIDVNGNKQWDGKNGQWDANTLIWVQERLLWTGMPAAEDSDPVLTAQPILQNIGSVTGNPIALLCPAGTPIGGYCNQAGPPVDVVAVLSDPWYNTIAQNADSDGCGVEDDPTRDKPIVRPAPRVVNAGTRYTYPAGDIITFMIGDARDPLAPPISQVPKHEPVSFRVPVLCKFTDSPLGGATFVLSIGTISGTIE